MRKVTRRLWVWALPAVGIAIHLGTAILRAQVFFPYPRLLDFSAFYASAWALRQGLSPYGLPDDIVQALRMERAIPFHPPAIYNPPVWPWLLQPLTSVDFGAAAFIWVVVNLACLACASVALARIAGYTSRRSQAIVFLLALTFGPVFLDLTLGQTSILLLALGLVVGRGLQPKAKRSLLSGALAQGVAAGAKLFPLVWLGAFVLLRRWRLLVAGVLAVLCALGLGFFISPEGNRDYWFRFLPERIRLAAGRGGLDDQSLVAWLDRVGRPQTYTVPGLRPEERVTVTWRLAWSIDPDALRWCGHLLSALLGLPVLIVLLRTAPPHREGGFYLWVLYTLLVFPHIERYNHALLLPAMAWLWSQGKRQRAIVIWVYVLTGLSRLNHLWVMLFPVPWVPLASGFGVYAVVLLGGGIVAAMWGVSRRRAREVW